MHLHTNTLSDYFAEPENKTRLWTIKNIPSKSLRSLKWPSGSEDAPSKVHVWPHLRKLSLLRAPGKEVPNSEYVLRFHWNQYNGQWLGPQFLHGKRLYCCSSCSLMNEGPSFCPGFADAESLLTFAITPWFRCHSWGAQGHRTDAGGCDSRSSCSSSEPALPKQPLHCSPQLLQSSLIHGTTQCWK